GPREWLFSLFPTYRGLEYRLTAHARPARPGGRPAKWKRHGFEALLAHESATQLEHDVARAALAATSSHGKPEAGLALGTPVGRELAGLLARRPRCRAAPSLRSEPEDDPPLRIRAGPLWMSRERGPGGALSPRFHAGAEPLPVPVRELQGREGSIFL